MRKLARVLTVTGLAGLVASAAGAAVTNTHHDLKAYQSATEVCLYCHGITDLTSTPGYGEIGALCVARCHAGNSAGAKFVNNVNPIPKRPPVIPLDDGTAVTGSGVASLLTLSAGHGYQYNNLLDPLTAAAVPIGNLAASGLPYTNLAANSLIQCTSCHNVHDNTSTPFLHSNLFTGGPAANRSFCDRCHTERGANWSAGQVAPTGEHPVNNVVTTGTVGVNVTYRRQQRYINFDTTTGAFLAVTSQNGAALNTNAQEYTTGGKVSSWGAVVSGTSRMGCYTCHATHLDTISGTGINNLVVRATNNSTVAGDNWNPLCVSCHGSATTNANNRLEQNPGTTPYTHPMGMARPASTTVAGGQTTVGYVNSNGTFPFTVNLATLATYTTTLVNARTGVNMPTSTQGYRIVCTSCHDVHGGAASTMAIADLDGGTRGTLAGPVCYGCHDATGLPDLPDNPGQALTGAEAANSHHRTKGGNITTGSTDANGEALTMRVPSWSTVATYGYGLAGAGWRFGTLVNGVGCADCHVFNGTAHNW